MFMCRSLKILMILAFTTLTVAACGKKGLLESPVAEQGKTSNEKKKEAKAAELKRKKGVVDPSARRVRRSTRPSIAPSCSTACCARALPEKCYAVFG